MAEQKNANRLISNNKKAYFDYFIEDKYEAGLVLHGTEVKSIRMGKCSIKEAYIQIHCAERIYNCAIAGLFKQRPCENGNRTWSW